jgi:ribosomal protein S18 acetylase RimI-like enzyme
VSFPPIQETGYILRHYAAMRRQRFVIEIRDYRPEDAILLTAVHNQHYPLEQLQVQSWDYLNHNRAWLVWLAGELVGYTAVLPVPGLAGLVELEGYIIPPKQRRGIGSALLHHIQTEVQATNIQQLSYAVRSLETDAARFLQKNEFFIEHEELTLQLKPIVPYPLPVMPVPLAMDTLPPRQAVPLFCQLYNDSFSGTLWAQPFTEAEMARELTDNCPLYFLFDAVAKTALGFIWVQIQSATAVTLEPIGIIKEKQGRGYGRYFLQMLLNQLAAEGIESVEIGVWANNQTAIHLYQSLGFKKTSQLTYLAFDL